MPIESQLNESRIQLHYAIQLIAATGAALAPPQPDHSHTSFSWDQELHLFVGSLIPADEPFRVGIDPIDLTALILNSAGAELSAYSLHQCTRAESLSWLQQEIAQRGADAAQVTFLTYPADFPDHPLAHGARFDSQAAELRQFLSDYYACTDKLLQEIITTRPTASAVRIWPHHFDMATLITIPTVQGDFRIGVGFSPGDATYPQPYWYVTPDPYPEIATLPPLELGFWQTETWVGAVLTTAQLQYDTVDVMQIKTFLQQALQCCQALLSG